MPKAKASPESVRETTYTITGYRSIRINSSVLEELHEIQRPRETISQVIHRVAEFYTSVNRIKKRQVMEGSWQQESQKS